jgi:hypothetical protein
MGDRPPMIAGEPPRDGEVYQAEFCVPVRWKAYKPTSEQFRHGIKGRWQKMNEYGGWENADHAGRHWAFAGYYEPEAFAAFLTARKDSSHAE